MPPVQPRYRLVTRIPTNAGRTVHIAETARGERVLVKQATIAKEAADLADQARHFRVMTALLGPDSPYPPVLESAPGRLVLPFYEHGSLDDLTARSSPDELRALLARALSRWIRVSLTRPAGISPPPEDICRTFAVSAAQARLARLDHVLATPDGRRWARHASRDGTSRLQMIDHGTAWLRDPAVLDAVTRISPRQLPLAGHGDFALGNILLAGRPGPASRLIFIDVHGLWCHGYPWWDPVADLAILIAYSCQIRPALARQGESVGADSSLARPAPGDIAALAAADPGFAVWAQDDPHWRVRLEITVAIRLLGNISIQLATASARPGPRAAIVLSLYLSHVRRISPLIGQLRSGASPVG